MNYVRHARPSSSFEYFRSCRLWRAAEFGERRYHATEQPDHVWRFRGLYV